jgi:hypothetical protein
MLLAEKPPILTSNREENGYEYYSFFVDCSTDVQEFLEKVVWKFNSFLDTLCDEKTQIQKLVGTAYFNEKVQIISNVSELNRESIDSIKLKPFVSYIPQKKRFLYKALLYQLNCANNLRNYLTDLHVDLSLPITCIMITFGIDEEGVVEDVLLIQKILVEIKQQKITLKFITNKPTKLFLQQHIGLSNEYF